METIKSYRHSPERGVVVVVLERPSWGVILYVYVPLIPGIEVIFLTLFGVL